VLAALGAVGITGLVLVAVGPARLLADRPASPVGGGRPFPDWAYTMPRGGQGYTAAFARPDVLATLPCFCGCDSFDQPHASLRECFIQPSGEIDTHGAFCETCQEEAIDAVAWAEAGVEPDEIHARIVAAYSGRDPSFGGSGCSSPDATAPAACTP